MGKNLRLDTNSAMSNLHLHGEGSPLAQNSFRPKKGSQVPESFLVPMVLRKTKLKQ